MDKQQSKAEARARWVREHRSIMEVMWAAHRWVYRLTRGAIGGRMDCHDVLVLTTTGRKSGKERATTLYFFRDGKNMVVVASNGGEDSDPAWWLNLKRNPAATVAIGNRKIAVQAEEAQSEERERLWSRIKREDPQYAGYEKLTSRQIPVVILRPVSPGN